MTTLSIVDSAFIATFHTSINDIDKDTWNNLCGTDYPFLCHEFIAAMENSGSTTKATGWQPCHLSLRHQADNAVIAVMPLFIKYHSYGEYVFDWSWAEAYQRHGYHYYPKLLNAIPFTPATGPRWGINTAYKEEDIIAAFQSAIINHAEKISASSCHILFSSQQKNTLLCHDYWQERIGYQYHWFNKDFINFDDFLSTMASRKRKNIVKERKKVIEQGITLETKVGDQISTDDWHDFYLFYQSTYYKRSGHQGYLSAGFFPLLAQTLSSHLVMIQAYKKADDGKHELVAAALCFKDSETLYGRYWGCKENYDSLHFEACYYQGIDFAIQHKLKRFDPGAQGEHKIQRGFTPICTYSAHWLADEPFANAIQGFLVEEKKEVMSYIEEAKQLLPFKNT